MRTGSISRPLLPVTMLLTGVLLGRSTAGPGVEADKEILVSEPDRNERFVLDRASGEATFGIGIERRGEDGVWRRCGTWMECVLHTDSYWGLYVWQPVIGQYDWDGKKQGYWRTFVGHVSHEEYYEDGARLGPCREYFEDGKLAKTCWFNGADLVGRFVEWDREGSKVCEGNYHLGKREGEWRFWSAGVLDPSRSGVYADDARVAPLPGDGE